MWLIIPIARKILFEMLFIWESHLIFFLRFMPRKLKVSTIWTEVLSSNKFGIDTFLCGWWNTIALVLPIFSDNLLGFNHKGILHNSLFMIWVSFGLFLLINVVSSAKKRKLNKLLARCISFIYIKKSKGPRMELWGTPVSMLNPLNTRLLCYCTVCETRLFYDVIVISCNQTRRSPGLVSEWTP